MARLIVFLLIFAVFLVFIGFNLENHCDVNLGFHKFENIYVFITVLVSFFFGMLCTIPVTLVFRGKKLPKEKKEKPAKKIKTPEAVLSEAPGDTGPYGID